MVDPTSEDEAEFSADDEDEGGGESTVAMQSPAFDSAMPSPVSIPPPGFGAAQVPMPMPPTAPIAFPPPGVTGLARPNPAPEPAKAVGMTAQSPAIMPGTFTRPKRAQTVIGIAPPGQGAQRPPASVPRTPMRPALDDEDADDGDPNGPPPTLTVSAQTPEQMFGLDEAAGAAARAAVRPNARHSPLASTGFSGPGTGPVKSSAPTRMEKPLPPRTPVDPENTATAFVEDLGLPLTAKAGFGALPKLHENEGDDESTRAVPREELFRSQDAQFVVGDDAAGDDATLAVAPGMNEAASQRMGGPLSADASGGYPAPFLATQQSPQFPMMGPPPSWNTPAAPGMQMTHGMSQIPSSTSAMPMMPSYPQSAPNQPMGYPPNPGMPGPGQSQPMPMMGYPNPGWPQQWGPPGQQQMVAPVAPVAMGGRPNGEKRKFPLSGQVIALGLVGIVCLAIFVTGVVLFFTTKF